MGKGIQYLKKNFDSAAIVTALATIAFTNDAVALTDRDMSVLAALRRSKSSLENAPLEDVQAYLQSMDEREISGVVSNVKGIFHEMEFVRLENDDGDRIYASYFKDTNHPDADIQLHDQATGDVWEVQLKATDETDYVSDWIESHPDGEIIVTEEIAERMDLPTSGQSNEELTADVEDLVDKLSKATESDDIWDYFPALSLASISIVIWALWRRYKKGEIDYDRFKRLVARMTGLKIAKIASIALLLSIPVVGQVTGAVLVAKLLLSAKSTWGG